MKGKGFKLFNDFGIRAWLGTLVVAPSVGALSYLAIKGSSEALAILGTQITAVLGFYFLTRREPPANGNGAPPTATP